MHVTGPEQPVEPAQTAAQKASPGCCITAAPPTASLRRRTAAELRVEPEPHRRQRESADRAAPVVAAAAEAMASYLGGGRGAARGKARGSLLKRWRRRTVRFSMPTSTREVSNGS